MTKTEYDFLLATATVRTVSDGVDGGGLFVQGVSQQELTALVELAGRQIQHSEGALNVVGGKPRLSLLGESLPIRD